MASPSSRRLKFLSSGVEKIRILNTRIGVLAILGMVTAASLHAQDKPQPQPTAPKKEAPGSATPAPPSAPADRAPVKPGSTDAPKKEMPASTAPGPSAPGAGSDPRSEQNAFHVLAEKAMLDATAQRFHFTIDPKTPLEDLLPTPPANKNPATPAIAKALSDVPKIHFQMPLDKKLSNEEALKQTAHTMAKINHLNDKNPDGFMSALQRERIDLAGLPFAMGEACRTTGDLSKQFAIESQHVRTALGQQNANAVRFSFPPPLRFEPEVAPPAAATPTPAPQPGAAPVGGPTPPPAATGPTNAPVPPPVALAPDSAAVNVIKMIMPVTQMGPAGKPITTQQVIHVNPAELQIERVTQVGSAGLPIIAEKFWENYQTICANTDKELPKSDQRHNETVTLARIAALMQVLAPESPDMRLGLIKYLSGISHAQATRALAKMSIFSTEDAVRQAAVDALKVRRERDYTDILVGGLHYPWPDVARRSAEAIVKLDRTDLIPQLVDFLDEPDPRAPVAKEVDHKKAFEARELVRINHHQNCLMCHAPANTGNVAAETLTAAVPTPQAPLPSPSQGYQNNIPDILVRLDVTYLRQDFSMLQPVADASPWPEMQRFDFLVRTRTLTEKDADEYREKLAPKEPGVLSAYHRAAVSALRELTGRDTAPTSDAWRQLLKLPAKPVRAAMAQ